MLGKLIKHEFRATGRIILPLFAVLTVLSAAAGFSMRSIEFTEDMPAIIEIVSALMTAGFFAVAVATVVIAYAIMISRFYKNLLGDEGYLMLTLPVSAHSHIWAKLIVSVIWFAATAVVIGFLMGLFAFLVSGSDVYQIIEAMPSAKELFAMFMAQSGYSTFSFVLFIVEAVVVAVVGMLHICLSFYSAMAVGHSFSNRKLLYSVLAYVVISFVMSIIQSVAGIAMGQDFGAQIMFNYRNFGYSMNIMMLKGLVLALVETAVLYGITVFCLKKKINLA